MRGYHGGIWHKSDKAPGGIIVSIVTQAQGTGIGYISLHVGPIWFRVLP